MNSAKKVNGQNRQRPKNGIGQLKPPAKKGAMAEKKERLKKKIGRIKASNYNQRP
jgi:hypothetical protein